MTENTWIYDCEVFMFDWLVIFHSLETGEKKAFHNDNYALAAFVDELSTPCIGGYNSKHYDQWILKAIYHGADNAAIKELNDFIIAGNEGWNFPFLSHKSAPWINFDLMDDIPVPLRLKEIEGNLGMDIEESTVPFDIDRPLTGEELAEVIKYCSHDVDAAAQLFEERKDYLASKIAVGAMKGMSAAESIRLTNAKLTAEYLDAKYYDRQDETEYSFPRNLQIRRYSAATAFFSKIDPSYESNMELEIAGVPHTLAWGGLHGALECYSEQRTESRKVMHIDVTSYYPSLMIVNSYLSRSAPDPEEFRLVYEKRIAAKKNGGKGTADALKLVLNTTYGAMKNPYNKLYDPRMANAVCISGQLYLIDLIEKLEVIPSFKLIQSNTDGLIVSYDNEADADIRAAVEEWTGRTGFRMGFDEIEKLVQKDVNNYVMRRADGKIEVKGGYVSNYAGGDFQNKSLVIVAKAIVAALLDGTEPKDTINACDELSQFQMICKAGKTYDKVIWRCDGRDLDVQNVNRVYASKDKRHGTIYKVKLEKEGQKARRDKIANLPDHCFIDNRNQASIGDIDKKFYIDMVQKRINDYLGIKPEKRTRRKTDMTTASTKPKTEQEAACEGLAQRLMVLREAMNKFAWEKDGKNRHQSYEYITEKQYKTNFKAALAAAGLDFKSSLVDYQFIPTVSDKMNMVIARFEFQIIDRASGETETYLAAGAGADTGDKGIYKAYTGAIKYFLANNFLVAEDSDPESDDGEVRAEKPRHASPERREEIKNAVTDQNAPATDEQLEAVALGINMLEEAQVDEEVIKSFTDMLETELSKAEAEQLLEAIAELLPDAAA